MPAPLATPIMAPTPKVISKPTVEKLADTQVDSR